MNTMRDDKRDDMDLERLLRATLTTKAGGIDSGPAWTGAPVTELHAPHHRGWVAPLLAAAAVIALVAGAFALRPGTTNHHRTPAATGTPSPSPTPSPRVTPTPGPAKPHAVRVASLSWFAMTKLAGFQYGERTSGATYRQVGVKPTSDTALPPGCNSCAPWTAYVTVFAEGRFDAATVAGWQRTTVHGATAYVGRTTWIGGGHTPVATLAWQFRSGRWAVVQGLTPATSPTAALVHIAGAVRPTQDEPLRVPFRLGYVPAGLPVTHVYEDQTGQYPTAIQLGEVNRRELDISVVKSNSYTGYFDTSTATPRKIAGFDGYVDAKHGSAAVKLYYNVILVIGSTDDGGTVTARSARDLVKTLDSLTSAASDARTSWPTAERAIP